MQRQKMNSDFSTFINLFLKDNPFSDDACTIKEHAKLYLTDSSALGIVAIVM
jgi:hypothetical protein